MKKIYIILFILLNSLLSVSQLTDSINFKDNNGLKEGLWKFYYDSGEIEQEAHYKDDKLEGLWRYFYESGNTKAEGNHVNNKQDGLWRYFYESGILSEETFFKNDNPNGLTKLYDESGNLESDGYYKYGKAEGLWKAYTIKGVFSFQENYKNGIAVDGLNKINNDIIQLLKSPVENKEIINKQLELFAEKIYDLPDFNNNNYAALYLNAISSHYYSFFNYEEAKKYASTSVRIFKNTVGVYHVNYLNTISLLANIYIDLNELDSSLFYRLEHIKIYEELNRTNSVEYYQSLIDLGYNYYHFEKYDDALAILKPNINKIKNIKNNKLLLRLYHSLGSIYARIDNFNKSLDFFNMELEELKKSDVKDSTKFAKILNGIGFNYASLFNYELAIKSYEQAARILSKDKIKNYHLYCVILQSTAVSLSYLKLYDKSNVIFDELSSLIVNNEGLNAISYSSMLTSWGVNYSNQNENEKALEMFLKSERIFNKNKINNSLTFAINKINMSICLFEMKKYQEAEEYNLEALKIMDLIIPKYHRDYSNATYNLSVLYEKMDLHYKSDSLKLVSIRTWKESFQKNHRSLNEVQRVKYISSLEFYCHKSLLYPMSFYNIERSFKFIIPLVNYKLFFKGVLLNTNQKILDDISSSIDKNLVNSYKKWLSIKKQLGVYYEKPNYENLKSVKLLEDSANKLEQKLSRLSRVFKENQKIYSWTDIKNKLKKDEAYVEIIKHHFYDYKKERVSDTIRYLIIIIDKRCDSLPNFVLIENGADLEQAGYKYYSYHTSGINKGQLDEYSYQNYWSKIAEKLKGKKRVYISSDGVYNKINLNVLYNKESKKYLGEEVDIRLITSGRDLFKTYPKKEKNKELTAVLVGSPNYDLVQEQVREEELLVSRDLQQYWIDSLSRGWSVSSLPGTAKEVSNISKLMNNKKWEVTTYTEAAALEGRVKSVSSPTVLHLATHGYFFEDVPKEEESPIRKMGVDVKKATQNPLLRSGLLFAGAKNTLNGKPPENGDNGLLTSYEASYMDLRSTELVVLSACNTARGEIKNGEGVYGLQRAIQQAGAENIIMSMWEVNDKVTQEFMTNFYDLWLSGKTKRDAFNQTQMIIKEKYKHPYYWGAFVMIGK